MDPRHSAQDIVRCDLCKENIVHNYCDFCHVSLCKPCMGEHISDDYYKTCNSSFPDVYPEVSNMQIHSKETCNLQYKSCNVFLCVICSVSHEHEDSDAIVLEDIHKTKKEDRVKDTEEIEKVIVPTYEDIRKDLINQIANLDGEYDKLATVISKQGEKLCTEVDSVINKMNSEVKEIKEKHCAILTKYRLKETYLN